MAEAPATSLFAPALAALQAAHAGELEIARLASSGRIAALELRVARLEAALTAAGLPLPASTPSRSAPVLDRASPAALPPMVVTPATATLAVKLPSGKAVRQRTPKGVTKAASPVSFSLSHPATPPPTDAPAQAPAPATPEWRQVRDSQAAQAERAGPARPRDEPEHYWR
jgi:hypothetical protein